MYTLRSALIAVLTLTISFSVNGQGKKVQIEVIAECGIPANQYKIGWGGYLKGLYHVEGNNSITFTIGLTKFKSDNSMTTVRLIPVLIGWRQSIGRFYVEPMAGLGELGGRIDIGGDWANPSIAALYLACAAGFNSKRIHVQLQVKHARGIEGQQGGIWHNESFRFSSICIGYDLIKK